MACNPYLLYYKRVSIIGYSSALISGGVTRFQNDDQSLRIPFCEEKRRLVKEFMDCSHELMELQAQQTKAVIDDDPDFTRFDDLIHMAREKKDRAKYALIAHMEEHFC